MSVIIFLVILAILILVHEFGHFIVAKKSGIRVDEFGLGFPPKIFSKKFGTTLYTLNAIPFGGFVKIFGEDPHTEIVSEEDRATSFFYKPKWIQAFVLVAGVTMNILFAWLVVSLGFVIGFPSPTDYSGFGKVSNVHVVVTEVLVDSPAQKAGLKSGDTIVSATSGKEVLTGETLTPDNIQKMIALGTSKNIDISYKRGNESEKKVSIEPNTNTVEGRRAIGIAMDNIGVLKLPVHLALLEGARTTWFMTKGTAVGLGHFFLDIISFKSDFSQVSGPVGIAHVVGEAQSLGFVYLLSLIAVISINLAIINLLPFPALDGGRLFFILIEVIIRRPISPSFVRWANTIGFAFLIILMLVVTGHDIIKLF
jgi:regulator of sigma E protease